jgi:hypothetical protein
MMIAGDGVCLRSNALPAPAHPAAVYAQGAPATGDPHQRVIPGLGAGEDLAFFLPLDQEGLLAGLRQASVDDHRWLVIATADDPEHLLAYTRASLEAVVNDNARFIDTHVRVYGRLGPYPAQVADGYRWFGWCRPRFTTAAAESIAADLATLTAANPPETRILLRRHGDTVEIVVGHGTDRQQTQLVPADPAGRFAVDGSLWCWETAPDDDPGHTVGRPAAAPPRCLCPRRCLLCGRPGDTTHATDCPWRCGSRPGHQPHLPAQPAVRDAHTHRPAAPTPYRTPPPCPSSSPTPVTWPAWSAPRSTPTNNCHAPAGGPPGHRTRCTTCGTHRDTSDHSASRRKRRSLPTRPGGNGYQRSLTRTTRHTWRAGQHLGEHRRVERVDNRAGERGLRIPTRARAGTCIADLSTGAEKVTWQPDTAGPRPPGRPTSRQQQPLSPPRRRAQRRYGPS